LQWHLGKLKPNLKTMLVFVILGELISSNGLFRLNGLPKLTQKPKFALEKEYMQALMRSCIKSWRLSNGNTRKMKLTDGPR
jgi:hypothetical protein